MSFRLINNAGFLSAMIVASALAGGLAFAHKIDAAGSAGMAGGMQGMGMQGMGMQGMGMQGMGMQGMGMHGKCKHGKCKHGKGKHGGKHLFGAGWKSTLSAEQKARLDQLHVNYAKTKAPLKARIKALEVELAVLATVPQPDKAVIDAKIAEMLRFKGQMLGARYGYIAAQRQVLTPQQQVSFDMEKIHGAMHGKKGMGGRGGKH